MVSFLLSGFPMILFGGHIMGLMEKWLLVIIMAAFFKSGSNIFYFSGISLVDKLSFMLVMLSLWLFMQLFVMSVKYSFSGNMSKYKGLLFFLFWFLLLSLILNDLMGFFIFFEVSLLPLFYILMGWGYQVERLQASFYLFMYTLVGSLPLLVVFCVLYFSFTLDWNFLGFSKGFFSDASVLMVVVMAFAFLIKLPMYGLHLWLPKAHVEAPVAGSMVLAAVLLKLSIYGFLRVIGFLSVMQAINYIYSVMLLWGAAISAFICLRQSDIKSMVAYSSVSHMGGMLMGFFFLSQISVVGSVVIMLSHGFCASALFLLVNFHYERTHSRQLNENRGQMFFFGFMGVMWFFFLVVNFSAPPFLTLLGELAIFFSCLLQHYTFLFILGLTSFIVASFCIYLYSVLIHGLSSPSSSLQLEGDISYAVGWFHFFPLIFLILVVDLFTFL